MVRWLKYTKAFLRLVRLPNLLIIAATMYLLRFFIVLPYLKIAGLSARVSSLYFTLLVLATVLIAAAGYVINDYFDRKADLINRPGRVVLGRILSRRAGMIWHVVLNLLGVGIGVFVSYKLGLLKYSAVFVLMSGLLWFYSTTYKRQVLIGNLIVSFMVAMVPVLILLYELPLLLQHYRYYLISDAGSINVITAWIGGYSIFAFLLTLIREIVKDLEDFEGDFAFGRQTIPIAWGANIARSISISIAVIVGVLLAFVLWRFVSDIISIVYVVLTLLLPLLIFIVLFYRSSTKNSYHMCSNVVKFTMLTGVLYTIVNFFINF